MIDARDTAARLGHSNALLGELGKAHAGYLALAQQNSALVDEISGLKKRIADFETWNAQKQRYSLHRPWSGATVYALKESASDREPAHWICADCYENGKRSILQSRHPKGGYEEFFCKCGSIVHSRYRGTYTIPYYRAEPEEQDPNPSDQEA
jgi:hypothetical protein